MTKRSRLWPLLAGAAVVSALAVGIGVALVDPAEPVAQPLEATLAQLDTSVITVPRDDWCKQMRATDVEAVLGAPAIPVAMWRNGEKAALGAATDVSHEFGCRWTSSADQTISAAVWVFAPPVARPDAELFAKKATGGAGCEPIPGAPRFGSPSTSLTCTPSAGGPTTISYRGLFGDAWLVCTVEAPTGSSTLALADRWCAAVLTTAGAANDSSTAPDA